MYRLAFAAMFNEKDYSLVVIPIESLLVIFVRESCNNYNNNNKLLHIDSWIFLQCIIYPEMRISSLKNCFVKNSIVIITSKCFTCKNNFGRSYLTHRGSFISDA